MKVKKIITIIGICSILFNPLPAKACDMPTVGIGEMIDNITIDQAKWAYAKELGEQLQSEELRLMSAIIWCEAGNQCEAGKQAVGIVVMNRVKHEDFEDTVETVIYEPGQFRPIDDGKMIKALQMYDEGNLPQECIDAAKYALSGSTIVNYNNNDIDMSDYLFFARKWNNARLRIQDHDFK